MHDMFSKVDANVGWYNYYIPPPVYKSHLQLNAEPHSCVWECTTHWHTVSDLLCTGVTYCIIHTVISENIGLVWWKVCV